MGLREKPARKVEMAVDTSDGFLGVVIGWPPGYLDMLSGSLRRVLWERYRVHIKLHMRELDEPSKGRVIRVFVELIGDPSVRRHLTIRCVHVGAEYEPGRIINEVIEGAIRSYSVHLVFADDYLREFISPLVPSELIVKRLPLALADIVAWLNRAYKSAHPHTRWRPVEDFIREVLHGDR